MSPLCPVFHRHDDDDGGRDGRGRVSGRVALSIETTGMKGNRKRLVESKELRGVG